MSTSEQVGDVEVELDVQQLVAENAKNVHERFNIDLDIEMPDGSIDPVRITGIVGVCDDRRYVLFDDVKPADTPLGNIQRRIARMNHLRIVDQRLMKWLERKVTERAKAREARAKRKAKS